MSTTPSPANPSIQSPFCLPFYIAIYNTIWHMIYHSFTRINRCE
jgi:hypothetical protein